MSHFVLEFDYGKLFVVFYELGDKHKCGVKAPMCVTIMLLMGHFGHKPQNDWVP